MSEVLSGPASQPTAKSTSRFEAVDSLRGFAALAVALHHLQVASNIYHWSIVRHAHLFVEFFFVLSGFVIAHAYCNKLNSVVDVKKFVIKRVARVWPLHLIMLGAFIAAETALFIISHKVSLPLSRQPFSEDRTLLGIPVNFFMLNGVFSVEGSAWNGPSWSISVELLTYMVFAGTTLFAGKRSLPFQTVFMCLALVILVVDLEDLNRLARCFYSFFLGVSVWHYREYAYRVPASLIEIAGLGVAFTLLAYGGSLTQLVVLPPLFALIIAVVATEKGRISSCLKNRICLALGEISYSVYMVHFFIAFALTNVIKVACKLLKTQATLPGTDLAMLGQPGWIMDLVTVAYLLLVVAVAKGTYILVEKPGMKIGQKIAAQIVTNQGAKAVPVAS